MGTRLAQAAQLRQALTACGALVMPTPQSYLRNAADAFDVDGDLADGRIRSHHDAWIVTLN